MTILDADAGPITASHHIDGAWNGGVSGSREGRTFVVRNPLDDSLVARVAAGGAQEAGAASPRPPPRSRPGRSGVPVRGSSSS